MNLPVLAYSLGAGACLLAWQYRAPEGGACTAGEQMWRLFALGLALMAFNALLGGEQLLVRQLRGLAHIQGWYALRRPVQALVLVCVLAAGLWVFWRAGHAAWLSEPPAALLLALLGVGLVLAVVCLRLVSYHYADALLNRRLIGLSLGRWLELAGLGAVVLGALRKLMLTYSLR